jgi:hypothetical protein
MRISKYEKGDKVRMFQRKVDETDESKPKETEAVDFLEIKSESMEELTTNALDCFGWKEARTEKWLIKAARIWYGIMSLLWFLTGCVTFAPIIFISKKVEVIFKGKKKSLIAGIVIYVLGIGAMVGMILVRNIGATV